MTIHDHLNTVRAQLELLREIESKSASEESAEALAALFAIEAKIEQLRAQLAAAREALEWIREFASKMSDQHTGFVHVERRVRDINTVTWNGGGEHYAARGRDPVSQV